MYKDNVKLALQIEKKYRYPWTSTYPQLDSVQICNGQHLRDMRAHDKHSFSPYLRLHFLSLFTQYVVFNRA